MVGGPGTATIWTERGFLGGAVSVRPPACMDTEGVADIATMSTTQTSVRPSRWGAQDLAAGIIADVPVSEK
jgi:hypothetical protein